ncbi:ABC transporter permease [Massilibacteroides sp.]|uniref:ABC transporter permease n=1 Tax=Massilibacteroides sp. TaxID=2034766 RepID=UPI0026041EE4|nr:ABC transporter permease [Massilibacteroides sp.]MDD4514687.1 ABC transporter permease [Massilibacteroides sp.]
MNLFQLAFKQIKSKPLSSILNILLFTSGIAIISLLLLLRDGFEEQMERNAKGVDLVVGAKGSPLQLILSGIYHVDYPTGNISYKEALKLSGNPLIKEAIPQAFGDNYEGYRIVGTTEEYVKHYNGELSEGRLWNKAFDAVIGAKVARQTGLQINDTFAGVHGLIEGAGHSHDDNKYRVTGILSETGTVLDQLVLTSIESVWEIHSHHEHDHGESEEHDHEHEAGHHHDSEEHDHEHDHEADREITSLLISYKNPMGAITLPRMINQSTNMQAASPAQEINRLYSLLGVGIETLNLIALFIILISAFSIFISLLNSLKERKYELALMRVMGGSSLRLFSMVIIEGISYAVIGYLGGFLFSRTGMWLLSIYAENNFHYDLSQWISLWDIYLLSLSLLIGILAAFIPALKAMKTDISKTLSE